MSDKQRNLIEVCQEYCTGCGLCGSVLKKEFHEDQKYFIYPTLNKSDYQFCKIICPASGNATNNYSDGSIWGSMVNSYLGWALDENIRFKAASGGILTMMCVYLLENNIVDGVIQVKADPKDPRKTVTVVNRDCSSVIDCVGSRYTTSSPLLNIESQIRENERYAFVGKPCDVSALRMFQRSTEEKWVQQIIYMFSFFCAGQSSLEANNKLLAELGCTSIKDCRELSYRGKGWPGRVTVTLKNGSINSMDYERSWMEILGRDVRKCCRFCADGTGEMSDVSCGDAWIPTSEGKPDFKEHDGRNIVFARTEAGEELLQKLYNDRCVYLSPYDIDKEQLIKIQPYHYNRKASLSSLKLATLLCRRHFPLYDKGKLKSFSKGYPLRQKVYRCLGTIKRIWGKAI